MPSDSLSSDSRFNERVNALIDSVAAKAVGGFTVEELSQLYHETVAALLDEVADLANPTEEKRALVVAAAGRIFDAIAPAIPVPTWLRAVLTVSEWLGFSRPIRALVLAAVTGAFNAATAGH